MSTPTTIADTAVEVADLTVRFSSNRGEVTALHDVDLRIGRGEFVSIVGPSGCGKSTLLKVVAGLRAASNSAAPPCGDRSAISATSSSAPRCWNGGPCARTSCSRPRCAA
ncbi:ABC-type transporter, ATP-binding protein [Mycobacteroides abscessus subsp. abscessus]|nr:ABC-type transporter, ATP-binding protein [Mycobacteroides abscessus subsp. abscessus]